MCDRCDALEARISALQDELAEWRRQAGDAEWRDREDRLIAALQVGLDVQPRVARAALALIQRAGRLASYDTLAAAIVGARADPYQHAPLTARVAICLLRRALANKAMGVEIRSLWGQGYLIPTEDAGRLLQRIEAAA